MTRYDVPVKYWVMEIKIKNEKWGHILKKEKQLWLGQ